MLIHSRGIRLVWLLGFVLLLGTALGAGWFFNQSASGTTSGGEPPILGVVGLGYVDVIDGVTPLHPLQPGRVKQVLVKEGDPVKQGDLLLTMDSELQQLKLREAQADLEAAKAEAASVESQLAKNHAHELAAQQKKIEAAQFELESAKKELEAFEDLKKQQPLQYEVRQNKLKATQATIDAEKELLKKIEDADIKTPVALLKDKVKAKQAVVDQAQRLVSECELRAPADGIVLRVFATAGETLSSQPREPALQFCPNLPRIVRVEILQEWADKVTKDAAAYIEDDTRSGTRWKGKVARVSDWFTHRRSVLQEPFQYNDVRTLECIVTLEPGGPPVRIGQRVRVTVKASGM
jgi:multidrug resistance efflux pump